MKQALKAATAGLIIFISCNGHEGQTTDRENTFPVTNPVLLDTVYYSEYVADINAVRNVEIRARVNGFLEKIHVDEGQRVKKGQLLFSITSQEYYEDLLKAKAMLKSVIAESKSAELNVNNTRHLVEKDVISETELEMASAKYEAVKARIDEARSHEASANLRLAFTSIKAPFGGTINRIPNKSGSLINEGDLLTTLADNSEVFAYFNISEKEYLEYTKAKSLQPAKKEAMLILANNQVHTERGWIETIEGEFDQSTGSIAFRARFNNPDGILKHGASGKVRLKNEIRNALVIPQKSTFEIQDKIYVYVVDSNNVARMKSFRPKLRIPHLYIVAAGLSTSDRIIYEGIQDVRDGMRIEPLPIEQQEIIRAFTQLRTKSN